MKFSHKPNPSETVILNSFAYILPARPYFFDKELWFSKLENNPQSLTDDPNS